MTTYSTKALTNKSYVNIELSHTLITRAAACLMRVCINEMHQGACGRSLLYVLISCARENICLDMLLVSFSVMTLQAT